MILPLLRLDDAGCTGRTFRDASIGWPLLSVDTKHRTGFYSHFHAVDLNVNWSLASNTRVRFSTSANYTLLCCHLGRSLYISIARDDYYNVPRI